MDVNGSRFHLLQARDEDWGECFADGSEDDLRTEWGNNSIHVNVEYDEALQLRQLASIFRLASRRNSQVISINQRRGSARDQNGNIYWVDDDNTGIRKLVKSAKQATQFYPADSGEWSPPSDGSFYEAPDEPPAPLFLRGLTVTTEQYLIVGYIQLKDSQRNVGDLDDVVESGVLIFDLHQNGQPEKRRWENTDGRRFMPWDMSAANDGSVYILDRYDDGYNNGIDAKVWILDRYFRINADIVQEEVLPSFQPVEEATPIQLRIKSITATPAYDLKGKAFNPISIETGPGANNRILIFNQGKEIVDFEDVEPSADNPDLPSIIVLREDEANLGTYRIERRLFLRVNLPDDVDTPVFLEHDFVYKDAGEDIDAPAPDSQQEYLVSRMFVAERYGNQVFSFDIKWRELKDKNQSFDELTATADYIPLRRWDGKALLYFDDMVHYDLGEKWLPTAEFTSCEYEQRAVILTPMIIDPGETFDSTILGCVWHRLLIDAEIPSLTQISLRARATDDLKLLEFTPWEDQPKFYLRQTGSELPYYTHPKIKELQASSKTTTISNTVKDDRPTGTWELLFQHIKGRYLQLEITIEGTGRATPRLFALRMWFPRFSYLYNYLPALYHEDPVDADFLDRWLAMFEGFFTNLEDKIEQLPRLLDPRSTPMESLDWLSQWMGLILDPLWNEQQRRFFIKNAYEFYRQRGTPLGLQMIIRLYLDKDVNDNTFWSAPPPEHFVRIEEAFIRQNIPDILATDSDHIFRVLVPWQLTTEQILMIDQIVQIEKPAHTKYTIEPYTHSFVIGEAILGLDTQLGTQTYQSADTDDPLRLGITKLYEAYLAASYPLDVLNRIVLNRDQVGNLPEL